MHNENYIPEASDPVTYVDGRLAEVALARSVRRGWKAGASYAALQLVALLILLFSEPLPVWSIGAGIVEVAVLCVLVYGVYKWSLSAAIILFLHPLASTVLAALSSQGGGVAHAGQGSLRIFLLVVFGVLFGRAVLAIRSFRAQANTNV